MAPLPATAAGTDPRMARCVRGDDLAARIQVCSEIIGDARDRNVQIRARNARGLALCGIADRCAEAVPDFAAIVRLSPKVAGYWDNDARALRAAKRVDDALAASNTAIGLAPRLAFTYFGKARTLEEAGRFAEAVDVVAQAIALAPTIAWPWALKGKLLAEAKDFTAAYAAFAQALILDPTRASVFVLRADAELADGRRAEAIADLERYPSAGGEADMVRGKLQALLPSDRPSNEVNSCEQISACKGYPAQHAASQKTNAVGPDYTPAAEPPSPLERLLDGPAIQTPGETESVPTITKAAPSTGVAIDARGVTDVRSAPAEKQKQLTAAPTASCDLSTWTPLKQCVQEYHTENDPFPTGPNQKRWNNQLAAEAKVIVDQHPEVQWDKTKWLAAKEAEDDASEEAELEYHAEQRMSEKRTLPDAEEKKPPTVSNDIEGDQCNSPRVLAIMTSNMDKFKVAVRKTFGNAKRGSEASGFAPTVDGWTVTIRNIRQSAYDTTNNIRSCEANFIYNYQLSPVIALFTSELPGAKALCAKAVTYKIERTLDDPNDIYVTHYCH